jgi:DNA-binding MltR family transcriptional regulator
MAQRGIVHHSEALKQLRERLSNEGEQIKFSDSTVLVILSLATHAHLSGDYDTAKHHMEGLRKIVDLRGGLGGFSYNTKLIMEILK